jgi:hypothetical protein
MALSDRVTMAIFGVCCIGTLAALVLTSAAKKANLTGPPPKPEWLQQQQFQRQLEAVNKPSAD